VYNSKYSNTVRYRWEQSYRRRTCAFCHISKVVRGWWLRWSLADCPWKTGTC